MTKTKGKPIMATEKTTTVPTDVRLRSMTGFGRSEGILSDRYRAEVVVRSVNHRHLEVGVRLRDDFGFLEPVVRRQVAARCRRGKVDASIRIRAVGLAAAPRVDAEALAALWKALESASREKGVPLPDSIAPLLSLPGILPASDPDDLLTEFERTEFENLLGKAIEALEAERVREGAGLATVLEGLRERMAARIEALAGGREEWVSSQAEALRGRIRTLAGEAGVEVARIDQEVAILADRVDVTEEIDRLRVHLGRFDSLLRDAEPAGARDAGRGRALDFLAQELSREVSTCGSKLRHPEGTGLVLELKGIIEKIREQAQNVE